MKLVLLFALALTLMGCTAHRMLFVNYDAPLVKVERPADVKARYGGTEEITISATKKYSYSDSLFDGLFAFHPEGISFSIVNKTDHTVKLIWDESVIIYPDNTSTKIMHDGIKYTDRNNSMPASVIPRHGKLEDEATPTDKISWSEGVYTSNYSVPGSWNNEGILPWQKYLHKEDGTDITDADTKPFYDSAKKFVGSKIGMLLPLEIEGVKNEYTFWFEVKSAEPDSVDHSK